MENLHSRANIICPKSEDNCLIQEGVDAECSSISSCGTAVIGQRGTQGKRLMRLQRWPEEPVRLSSYILPEVTAGSRHHAESEETAGGGAAHSPASHTSHPPEMGCTMLLYKEGLRNSLAAATCQRSCSGSRNKP